MNQQERREQQQIDDWLADEIRGTLDDLRRFVEQLTALGEHELANGWLEEIAIFEHDFQDILGPPTPRFSRN